MNPPQGEEAIFDAALCLPPKERSGYVAGCTEGNPELRQRVEVLLGNYEAGTFLEQVAAPGLRQPRHLAVPLTEKPGDTIGRYKLLQQIGEGGCGVVYMAEQLEPVRRRVALKIIKLGMDTKSVIARFEAERQALALMDHPNIAKVLEAGATETGRPYFVMELVRGMKITEYCDEQKLSTRARLDLFMQVCQAIQHAHQKGIIHRDIKPSNILVGVDGGAPALKVIDFGIAKATSGVRLTDRTLFTAFEQFIGTPAYMSPEQAMLTNVDVDTRSDIYALGVLLYELLTGKTPFGTPELLAIGLDEMRRTIREQEPLRPSTRLSTLPGQELSTTAHCRGLNAPKLVTELRGDLDWIVMKALEKDRVRRYDTANGLASDIRRHLNNEPVMARPPSKLYRVRKAVQRNKLAFAAGSALAASLLIGATLSTVLFFRERSEHKRAEGQTTRANEQTARANQQAASAKAVSDFLVRDLLEQSDSLTQALEGFTPDPNLTVRQALHRAAAKIGHRFKDQPLQEAAIQHAIGAALRGVGESERGIEHLKRSLQLARAGREPHDPATFETMHNLALAYMASNKRELAGPLLEETLALMKDHVGADHYDTLSVMNDLASAYVESGKLDQALSLYEKTLKLREAKSGLEDAYTLGSMNNLAMGLQRAGRLDQAVPLLERTVELMRRTLRPEHPYTQNAMSNLAQCYRDAGKFDEALPLFRTVLELRKASLGLDDPLTLWSMNSLADTLVRVENYAQAETLYRDALKRLRPPFSGGRSREIAVLGVVMHHLADLLRQRNILGEARSLAEEAIAVYDRHPDWPTQERHHAFDVLQAVLKELGASRELAAARQKQITALRVSADRGDLAALNNLAWIMATSADSAVRDGRTAVAFAEKAVAKTARKDPGTLDTLAAAYAEAGDFAKAEETQLETIRLSHDESKKSAFTTRLKLYQSKTPCREPQKEQTIAGDTLHDRQSNPSPATPN
jgi:serine/threonine protein kinase